MGCASRPDPFSLHPAVTSHAMEVKEAALSLEYLLGAFNRRMTELQDLVIARNMYPASSVPDLTAVDAAVKAIELQVQTIRDWLREETLAIPKAKRLIEASLQQQKNLQSISLDPSCLRGITTSLHSDQNNCSLPEGWKEDPDSQCLKVEVVAALPKEKKGRGPPPLWYITSEELDSLSSYMRGRLTLEKVNAAINDMGTYAEATAKLVSAPNKKLPENMWEKALELRDIAMTEGFKGKHFFIESDIKGPSLKMDNTGKAILTVLRHLGRISETRVGSHRVITLLKPL